MKKIIVALIALMIAIPISSAFANSQALTFTTMNSTSGLVNPEYAVDGDLASYLVLPGKAVVFYSMTDIPINTNITVNFRVKKTGNETGNYRFTLYRQAGANMGQIMESIHHINPQSNVLTNGSYTYANSNNPARYIGISSDSDSPIEIYDLKVTYVADTTAPAIPTGLTAAPGDGKVDLNWTANTEPDLRGYNVYRDAVKITATPITIASHTDTGRTNGTTYSYTITAVDKAGNESNKSQVVTGTPTGALDTTPPAIPTGLAATPGNGKVDLNWTANTEPDLRGYNVYRDGVKITATPITTRTYTDTGRTNGTEYSYTITAIDISGNESGQSVAATATPMAAVDTTPPAIPAGLTATPGDGKVDLNWAANTEPDLRGYNVYRDGVKITTVPITATTYNDTGRTNGTTHSYWITAVDTTGNESSQSATVTAIPTTAPQPPAPPTGLKKTILNESIRLEWQAVTGATSYLIYRDGVQVGTAANTTFTDTGLTNHENYLYTVVAVNEIGESPPSSPIVAAPADAIQFNGVLPFSVPDMLKTAVNFLVMYGQWVLLALGVIFSPVLYHLAMQLINKIRGKEKFGHKEWVLRERNRRLYWRSEEGKARIDKVMKDAGYSKEDIERANREDRAERKAARDRDWEKVKQAELRDLRDPALSARREAARTELRSATSGGRSDREGRPGRSGRSGRSGRR